MASIAANSYPLKFNFIDNPIVLNIKDMEYPDGATFKQIKVSVLVTPGQDDKATKEYMFGVEVGTSSIVSIDISSALCAVMNEWYPSFDLLRLNNNGVYDTFYYPYTTFEVEFWEEYMLDGEIYYGTRIRQEKAYAYYGGLSEYERMVIQNIPADYIEGRELSKKPKDGEQWGTGDLRISNILQRYTTEVVGNCDIVSDGILKPGTYYHFLFVNSLGVLETCSAVMKEELLYNIESAEFSQMTSTSYFAHPNILVSKHGGRAQFNMSSGYVNIAWADWWTTEFLMAKHYWIRMGSSKKQIMDDNGNAQWIETPLWLPCVVTPVNDSTSIYNKAEHELPHVDFEVKISVSGSVLNTLV